MKTTMITSALILATSNFTAAVPTVGKGWSVYKALTPFDFTSTHSVIATPDQVYNTTTPPTNTFGEPSAVGYFNFGINSEFDVICYNSTLKYVTGPYQSLAKTATHIHQAGATKNGPPRLAFPNPEGDDSYRNSIGCLKGPFTTGIVNSTTGVDTGAGFMVKQIEENPANFFCDSHTAKYVPGVVRGQLA